LCFFGFGTIGEIAIGGLAAGLGGFIDYHVNRRNSGQIVCAGCDFDAGVVEAAER